MFLAMLVLAATFSASADTIAPVISDVSPLSATNGALITITGENFSPIPTNDLVRFGAVATIPLTASATQLTVLVPAGVTLAPVSVTVEGLTTAFSRLFVPTFNGDGSPFGTNSLGNAFTLPAGASPGYILIADLDGDGRPDLADVDGNSHTLSIFHNIGTNGVLSAASFAPDVTINLPPDLPSGCNPLSLHAVDLDGDGRLDLVVAELGGDRITILQNQSTPGTLDTNSFAAPLYLYVGNDVRNASAADLDGDGRPDLVASLYGSSQILILKNLASPGPLTTNSFAAPVGFALPAGSQDFSVGDLDGDGKPDLAVSIYGGAGGVSIFRNTATTGVIDTNSFAPRVDFPGLGNNNIIAMGDLDGDGKPDLVVSAINPQAISVYRNLSSPGVFDTNSLAPEVDFSTPGWAHSVALADLTGNGKLDIAVVGELPSYLSVFPNVSTPGSFTSASLGTRVDFATGWNAWGVAAGDLAGNGQPDLIFANQYDGVLMIYQNLSPLAGPPSISTQPADQTIGVGEAASFSVVAGGSGNLSYQWSYNGTPVYGATNATLNLSSVQPNQAGSYQVAVTNVYGAVTSSPAMLTVLMSPVITSEPVSQSVTNGVNVTFGAGVTGADLTYEWLFNGVPLQADDIITTAAGNNSLGGGYSGDGGPATNAAFYYVAELTRDVAGNLYIADTFNFVIRKVSPDGTITTVAGNNSLGAGYSGDGGPATNATLNYPAAVAVDGAGNLFIADTHNHVIRKVDAGGTITTVVGNSALGGGYAGDGGAATNAALNFPVSLSFDGAGNLYIAEFYNHLIRKVSTSGIISTVAGNHNLAGTWSGDGGPATNAGLNLPAGILADGSGNLYITEDGNNDIRKVDAGGTISTIAGNPSLGAGYSGDGGPATNAALNYPEQIAEDTAGNLYFPEYGNNIVREVTTTGLITTVAGNQSLGAGYSGDGGAATNAALNNPTGVALDAAGNLYIGDTHNNVVRKVGAANFYVNPTNGALTISAVQAAQSGNYQVVIANSAGSITSSVAKLVVHAPPVITVQPLGATVPEGGPVTLAVTAFGTAPVKYQWTFNGTKIYGATGTSLTITNLHPWQTGNYAVKVSTPDGNITSSNALVTVIAQPILVYSFSGSQNSVAGGQSATGNYTGELIYLPGATNGTFVGWGRMGGQKRYWVDEFTGGTLYTVAGPGSGTNSTTTVLAQAGQGLDANGNPSFWSAVYQGPNSRLTIGQKSYYNFPVTLSAAVTDLYADPLTGKLLLFDSNGNYTFAAATTQAANNTGQTPADLLNGLIKSLFAQGYRK